MTAKRRLVITADDYGYDQGTNEAIWELMEGGFITATTVISAQPSQLGSLPEFLEVPGAKAGLGLHFVLNSDRGREPWQAVRGGDLLDDPAAAVASFEDAQVAAEMTRQFASLVDHGGSAPARLDSHSGTLYGLSGKPFIEVALGFCAQHQMGLRLPRTLDLYFGTNVPQQIRELHKMAVQAADQLGVALPQAMATNQQPADQVRSYDQLLDSYLELLPLFPEGTSEVFLHPSNDSSWARERFGDGWNKRVWEFQVLQDPRWLEAIEEQGIQLVPNW